MRKCDLVLPNFELLKRQPKIPHVARIVVQQDIPNEHGTPVTFTVKQSRNRKQWWISASLHGFRQSNTIGTTKPDVAERWIQAVKKGRVCIKPK